MEAATQDVERGEDRTCARHGCEEFGTHRVTTRVYGHPAVVKEWMCPFHSLEAVLDARMFGVGGVPGVVSREKVEEIL